VQFTARQQQQLHYLDGVEQREELHRQPQLDCSCADCHEGALFNSADGARTFVRRHMGHRTWVQQLGFIVHQGRGS
jgi:hypothetical protein